MKADSRCTETGNSMVNLLLFFLLIAVLITFVIKIVPVYYDNLNLQHILRTEIRAVKPDESVNRIRYRLQQRLDVQMLDIPSRDITIKRTANGTEIIAEYTKKIPLAFNMALLIAFKDIGKTP